MKNAINSSIIKLFLDFLENSVITITSQQQTAAQDLLSKQISDLPSIIVSYLHKGDALVVSLNWILDQERILNLLN